MKRLKPHLFVAVAVGAGCAAAVAAATIGQTAPAGPGRQTADLPAAKRKYIDNLNALRAAGLAHPAPKPMDPALDRPAIHAEPLPPTGIIKVVSPFSPEVYNFDQFGWQQVSLGRRITVFVGALRKQPTQGIVLVWTSLLHVPSSTPHYSPTLPDAGDRMTEYRTPGQDGAVHVVAATGAVLTLRADDGATMRFDVNTGKFV